LAHDREPESAALRTARTGAIDLIEPLEDPADVVGRNVRPGIVDVDGNPTGVSTTVVRLIAGSRGNLVGLVRAELDRTGSGRVPNRVVEQIHEHLLEAVRVGENCWSRFGLQLQRQSGAVDLRL